MVLELHTVSRDKLFDALATYEDGEVTVKKGSFINLKYSDAFKPAQIIVDLLNDKSLVGSDGILTRDVKFKSLSTAATFVAGRISNGMITWKTPDGEYVRKTLKK